MSHSEGTNKGKTIMIIDVSLPQSGFQGRDNREEVGAVFWNWLRGSGRETAFWKAGLRCQQKGDV